MLPFRAQPISRSAWQPCAAGDRSAQRCPAVGVTYPSKGRVFLVTHKCDRFDDVDRKLSFRLVFEFWNLPTTSLELYRQKLRVYWSSKSSFLSHEGECNTFFLEMTKTIIIFFLIQLSLFPESFMLFERLPRAFFFDPPVIDVNISVAGNPHVRAKFSTSSASI